MLPNWNFNIQRLKQIICFQCDIIYKFRSHQIMLCVWILVMRSLKWVQPQKLIWEVDFLATNRNNEKSIIIFTNNGLKALQIILPKMLLYDFSCGFEMIWCCQSGKKRQGDRHLKKRNTHARNHETKLYAIKEILRGNEIK